MNDPSYRADLMEQVGIKKYNELMDKHIKDSTVDTVNGYPIRKVSSRFGMLYAVGGTTKAFKTLDQARDFANKN